MNPELVTWCNIINQLYTLEVKTRQLTEKDFYQRRFDRIRELLDELNIHVHDPIGESYEYSRTDCEGIIEGETHQPLVIVEVVKPIIYYKSSDGNRILQQGIVIIKGKAT